MKVPDKHFVLEKVRKYLHEDISPSRNLVEIDITGWQYAETHADDAPHGYADFLNIPAADFKPINHPDLWGGYNRTAWFKTTVSIPADFPGNNVQTVLHFDLGEEVEGLVYVNGKPVQGIDVWHHDVFLVKGDIGTLEVAVKAWSNLEAWDGRMMGECKLIKLCKTVDEFFFTADVLAHSIPLLDEHDLKRIELTELLRKTFTHINFLNPSSQEYHASIKNALEFLKAGMESLRRPEVKPTVHGVGHSHIDMAWLWRLCATREKASRTFSTVLNLMWQYPEYLYMHSSPQLYKFLEEDYPEIFSCVKEKIGMGQWEAPLAMLVHADTNVPSRESLVRQFLYGKRYLRKEFGQESRVLWLPDVFGYSAALPQIAKKAGVDYFMTTKISWNQYNHFPHDTFVWRGLDGTELLTHFITTPSDQWFYTYNGEMKPDEIPGIWRNYKQKSVNSDLLLSYGWGDGGGGPTREMLETRRAIADIPGLPYVKTTKVEPYFELLAKNLEGKALETWDGELYFEYHRGTYTSQGYNKKANRQMETNLHDGEFLSVLAGDYPKALLDDMWERVLLLQFHDIIPGSSIREVYEDSRADYAKLLTDSGQLVNEKGNAIAAKLGLNQDSVVVFNTLSFMRDGEVFVPFSDKITSDTIFADASGETMPSQQTEGGLIVLFKNLPPMGYKSFAIKTGVQKICTLANTTTLETPFYSVQFAPNGEIASLYDKEACRQVGKGNLNVLQAFEDKPMMFDAWDIDVYYKEKPYNNFECIGIKMTEQGSYRTVMRRTIKFNKSKITQDIIFYNHTRRIDFKTIVDWQEKQVLLKAAFPVDIRALNASYDVQFGYLERANHNNDERDFAQFEVCGHKWADISEPGYGVALLNNCKYGHDCKDSVLRLTLIKSPIDPDETADRCVHEFDYALYPHIGNLAESDVQTVAAAFNASARAFAVDAASGNDFAEYSMLQVSHTNVVVDTVKKAEDGDDIVLRVFENGGRKTTATITLNCDIKTVLETNLLEEDGQEVSVEGNAITFDIKPFEVKTFKIQS